MLVKLHFNYASSAWDPYTITNISNIERVQNAAARFVKNTYTRYSSVTALKDSMGWIPLQFVQNDSRLDGHQLQELHLTEGRTNKTGP